jgi:ubiquinone/menaquinone biosynthesis C-methylase UbiE
VGAGSADAVFLIFAAHEIRSAKSRREFFAEMRRVLAPSGRIVLVEHLRDWRNFAAFGPGCFHFQSRQAWLRAANKTGFSVTAEFGVTPFVRIFTLKK